MPKVTEEHRAARRDEILDAALLVFSRSGYRGSSITKIIQESGLSAGAIYSYFPSKKDLFHAAAERSFSIRTSVIKDTRLAEPRSPGILARLVLTALKEEAVFTIAPQVWAEAPLEPELQTIFTGAFVQFQQLLSEEIAEWATRHPDRITEDPETWANRTVQVLVSLIPGFIVQHLAVVDFDEAAYLDAVEKLFDS